MFEWFKNLFKKKELPPVVEDVVEISEPSPVKVKVQDNAPQVKDYPRSMYNAYWETFYNVANNRHSAKVRFCAFNGKVLSESELTAASKVALFDKINALILAKMESFKR